MPEKINLSVGGGSSSPWFPIKCTTHEQVIKEIKRHRYEPKVTAKLIKAVKSYPNNAIGSFIKNFNTHLAKAQGKK